jgi:hypothetical protein
VAEPTTRARQPKRPAHLPHGRWLGDLGDLSPFEKRLVAACARGEVCAPDNWDGKRPEADAATEANTIRAELIRFLALGGDSEHPTHEKGLMIKGASITGEINLQQSKLNSKLDMQFCTFDSLLEFSGARVFSLSFSGCDIPGFSGDNLHMKGSLFFDKKFKSTGLVSINCANIDGNIECQSSSFKNINGDCIAADQIRVSGSVFFDDNFESIGEIRLLNAQIGGLLSLRNGSFLNNNGDAISADGINISGGLLINYASIIGRVRLPTAKIGSLIDDFGCWVSGNHIIDGLCYDRIIGPTDASTRIAWLNLQFSNHLNDDFRPQPWEQLIKVLRDMGHPYDAEQVAIAKQKQLRKAGQIEGLTRKALHWIYGFLAGYGYQPMKLVVSMIWLWLGCAFFFSVGGGYGYMGPSTPLLNNPELALSIDESCGHRREVGKQVWTKCAEMPAEYTTFQPLLYSLDLILQLVDLQQESDWAPIVEEAPGVNMGYGVFLRWLMWFEILFGWMASLMLVAILGRLVDKD